MLRLGHLLRAPRLGHPAAGLRADPVPIGRPHVRLRAGHRLGRPRGVLAGVLGDGHHAIHLQHRLRHHCGLVRLGDYPASVGSAPTDPGSPSVRSLPGALGRRLDRWPGASVRRCGCQASWCVRCRCGAAPRGLRACRWLAYRELVILPLRCGHLGVCTHHPKYMIGKWPSSWVLWLDAVGILEQVSVALGTCGVEPIPASRSTSGRDQSSTLLIGTCLCIFRSLPLGFKS
mmetsp:Transcript_8316/g.23186  ORF Transcript_8316/g.23186 Transcript_8316/m.23186 type:complete len:231 (+) Transcript_8316:1295-1987(+)